MTGAPRVAVIGGGLAGITAALRCADAGMAVTLLEGRPKLGGLTHSFRRAALDVDNGQHVFLRCCTSYLQLLQRLAVRDQVHLQDRLDIVVRTEALPRPTGLRRQRLPAPLHLSTALLRYRALSPFDRLRVVRGALALRALDVSQAGLDARSLSSWLAEHGQNERTLAAMWDLFTVATLNVGAGQASLALAATVFQTGLLFDSGAGDIGWSRIPLQQLHADSAMRCLPAAGATVCTATKVSRLERRVDGWKVSDRSGVDRTFEQVILAVDAAACEALVPSGALLSASDQPLTDGWAQRLGTSPILNAHLVFDRRVMSEPFFAGVDTPVQWAFDRSVQSGLNASMEDEKDPSGGQYIAVSLSAADHLLPLPTAELKALVVPAFLRLVPAARTAELLDFFITREAEATFRPAPGSASLRAQAATTLPGLAVAGAWTATGWPATMEGAVRSGNAAADALLRTTLRPDRGHQNEMSTVL